MAARALVVAVPETSVGNAVVLNGTTRDASNVAALLQTRGFKDVRLHDHGLTVEAFVGELIRLRDDTESGDLALIYVSGHGARIADTNGDEADDHFDECLAMSDALLPDDWWHDHFWPYTDTGSWWVTCLDACFSLSAGFAGLTPHVVAADIPDSQTGAIKHLPTPTSAARIWMAAAADDEEALELTEQYVSGSWYSDAICSILNEDPALSYEGLWVSLQKRWIAATKSNQRLIPRTQMFRTSEAAGLAEAPAFSALGFESA